MKNIILQNSNNAIEKVAFIFVLSAQINDTVIKNVITNYQNAPDMIAKLPRCQPQNMISFQIGGMIEQPQHIHSPMVNGVIFDTLLPDGRQKWFVNLANNFLTIGCSDYTRWDEVWATAKEYIDFFMPSLEGNNIQEIGIEYIDEFKISDASKDWKKELFRENNDFIPNHIWSKDDFWHIHQGYYLNHEHKNLNNINMNYFLDEKMSPKVVIQTHHKTTCSNLIPVSTNSSDVISAIEPIIEQNHLLNKEVMCNLLSSEICTRIQLECK
ncbi:MAG: TIGR04255 family protein [Sulfurimonas sp.]|uniref:TIGR04255 family protein n=1 Tax=Sulfurimonas sp. TaxID=2022749 RepID=UPI00262C5B07|nr:TIGR04255 family protein [Sulfurimonas sp.]MDD5400610.1 TIGR04255 family protein [Sulfurimonas sp.]